MKVKTQIILPIITALLVLTNVLLIRQNLTLKAIIDGPSSGLTKEGDNLAGFNATNLDGDETKIDFQDNSQKRILLFF